MDAIRVIRFRYSRDRTVRATMRQYALEVKHRDEIITWHRRWVTDGAWLDLAAPRYSPL